MAIAYRRSVDGVKERDTIMQIDFSANAAIISCSLTTIGPRSLFEIEGCTT